MVHFAYHLAIIAYWFKQHFIEKKPKIIIKQENGLNLKYPS